MWWLPIAMGLGSALQENRRENNLENYNKAQAEMTRYSPWTGVSGHIQQDTGPGILGAGIGGAVSGLGAMQAFNKAMAPKAAATTSGASPITMPTMGQSAVAAKSPYSLGVDYSFDTPAYGQNPYLFAMNR